MNLKATILGCGSSGGVPRVGGDWGVCDPKEPKNRRTRCSLLIECWSGAKEPAIEEKTIILIDTSPDLREQLLGANVKRIDALLYTHDHADQTHGIDDLRALAYRMRKKFQLTWIYILTSIYRKDLIIVLRYLTEGIIHQF